jgi:hypothetical protein
MAPFSPSSQRLVSFPDAFCSGHNLRARPQIIAAGPWSHFRLTGPQGFPILRTTHSTDRRINIRIESFIISRRKTVRQRRSKDFRLSINQLNMFISFIF